MIQHFNYKPMYAHAQLPGWIFSFYLKNIRYAGEYLADGQIIWTSDVPPEEDKVKDFIHELMVFHVYE